MAERVRARAGLPPAAALFLVVATLASPARARTPIVLAGPGWSAAETSAVERALDRLPAAVLAQAPRAIWRDARPCDAEGWPDDGDLVDARGVHLCLPDPRLSPADLGWRVAVALSYAFDRAVGWSDDPAWRRLNGWRPSLWRGLHARPANVSPQGFASPRGRRSPRWDLATFLAALSLEAPDPGGGVGCRLLSQTEFVRRRLGEPRGPGHCDAFERWADLDHLAAIEVVLAAPSTAMVGSLFGHVLLRLVYQEEDGDTPLHLSRAVAFLADNDVPFDADPGYAWKGIFGLYDASLHERAFLDAYRDYVVIEGRDLHRRRLNVDAAERRAIMERVWTVAHAGLFPYYFFKRNCATMMVDLLDDARPSGHAVAVPGVLAAPPASTLEAWADARGADGAPLLEPVPEPMTSFESQARAGARHRRALEPRIAGALAPPAAAPVERAFHDAHDAAPAVRAAAYERLAALLTDAGAGTSADVTAWLRASAVIEAHLATLANLEAEAREDRARRRRVREAADALAARLRADCRASPLAAAVASVSSPDPEARLLGYRALLDVTRNPATAPDLAARVRLLALLESEARYDVGRMTVDPGLRDALLFPDPAAPIDQQPYVAGRGDLIRLPIETRVAPPLRSLQRTRQVLFAARNLADAAVGAPAPEQPTPAEVRREYEASMPHSGLDQIAVSAGGAFGRGTAAAAGLVLGGALYDERLGDHRRFGFRSDTALVVGRSTALLAVSDRAPRLASYDARIIGYRSLRTPLPESGAGRWPFGWELTADLAGNRTRPSTHEASVGWGLLARIVDRGGLTDHVIAALSVAYDGIIPGGAPGASHPQGLAAPFALEARAGLGAAPRYRSFVAARAWAKPILVLAGAPRRFASETGASVDAHLALAAPAGGLPRDPALLISARILRSSLASAAGEPAAVQALLTVGIELR